MPEVAVWYSPLKWAHIGLVLVSGGLFSLRRASDAGALLVYLFMASVAPSHHPLGFLHVWLTHGD